MLNVIISADMGKKRAKKNRRHLFQGGGGGIVGEAGSATHFTHTNQAYI